MQTERLPILDIREALVARLRADARVVIQAPTGAGKSTQAPPMVLDHGLAGNGQVLVLQPRRLAARLLARRVAQERGGEPGREVGYHMRLERCAGPETRILFITEGVLLRRMLADPVLADVGCIVFDEFHERRLYGDVSLALAAVLQRTRRPDLKLIVMSATLDIDLVARYLDAQALRVEGRRFAVDVQYLSAPLGPNDRVWTAAAAAWERAARRGAAGGGDALIFMPGAYEIRKTIEALAASPLAQGHALLPLHGELPPAQQDAAVARHDRPKIIVATNVAETSLTIEGIRLVIDSGLARIPRFDPRRGIDMLWVERISRAAAEQRAGRAGRTAPGVCVRLWTEREHNQRPERETPEIARVDLAETLLLLKALGTHDARRFPWIEPPAEAGLARAEQLLADLGALEAPGGAITDTGRRMLPFPLHPRTSRMLLEAGAQGCVKEAALLAALTQEQELLIRNPSGDVQAARGDAFGINRDSDFFTWMAAWEYAQACRFAPPRLHACGIRAQAARNVGALRDRFIAIARREGLAVNEAPAAGDTVRRCLLAGFADQLAARTTAGSKRFALVHGRRGVLAQESGVTAAPLIVAAQISEIEGAPGTGQVVLSLATAIERDWLEELFPEAFAAIDDICYDGVQRRVVHRRRRLFRDLELERRITLDVPPDAAAEVLAAEILAGRLALSAWNDDVAQWIARVNCLAAWCPELGIQPFGEEDRRAVLEQICHGAVTGKDVRDRPVRPVLNAWYNPAQCDAIERLAPERIALPRGRKVRVTYAPGAAPYIAARIQDLYGLERKLTVAAGKITVLVHVLAPNFRPVQITDDMPRFWTEHYPRIKQELQRRYWKHEWR